MHINDLPADILIAILKPICEEEHYKVSHWISRLSMLAVCRKWRHLALPMVYKKVSIDCDDKIRTNLDLMTEKMIQYPRKANIWIDPEDSNTANCLQLVLEKFKANKAMLSKITYLYMHVMFSTTQTVESQENLQEIAGKLKSFLPHVSTLYCHINTFEEDGLKFEAALVKQYASQLEKVEMDSLSLHPEIDFTDSLSIFSLWWYPGPGLLPKVNTTCLTKLELLGIDDSFNWSVFSPNKNTDSGVLCFPALEYMFIDVLLYPRVMDDEDEDENEDGGPLFGPDNEFDYVLEAPNLRFLQVSLCPFACSLLAAIPTSTELEKLEIMCMDDINYALHGFTMSNSAKRVFEKHYNSGADSGTIDIIGLVNDLQSIHGLVKHGAHMYIDRDLSSTDIQNIYWPQVSSLSINSPISLTDILILIESKLPDIMSLKSYKIKLESLEDGSFFIPELQDIPAFSQIKSKIESFVYGFDKDNNYCQERYKGFVSFMFSTIESLKKVSYH